MLAAIDEGVGGGITKPRHKQEPEGGFLLVAAFRGAGAKDSPVLIDPRRLILELLHGVPRGDNSYGSSLFSDTSWKDTFFSALNESIQKVN